MFPRVVLPVLAVVALAFAVYYVDKSRRTSEAPSLSSPPIEAPDGSVLAGSGIVEPQTQNIAVGSPLPGIIVWVIGFDRLGSVVEPGEVLFRLDDRQTRADLELRKAMLATARAELERLDLMPRPEDLVPLEAKFAEAKVNEADQQDQFKRSERLYRNNAMSIDEFRRYYFSYQAAVERRRIAEADLALLKSGTWQADRVVAEARVREAEAQVRQAETELERLEVRALTEGELLQINVRPGEFVGAVPNQNLVLLGNTRDLHVRVDIDEHDVPLFRSGMPAQASLRGHPEHVYPLEFVRVEPYIEPKQSLTGDNMERVDTRVLQLVYRITGGLEDRPLYVGQQMDVFMVAADEAPAEAEPSSPTVGTSRATGPRPKPADGRP